MQRTLTTLGLTLLLFGCGRDGRPPYALGADLDSGTFCSLPEEQCFAFDGENRTEDADSGMPVGPHDASTFFDAGTTWDATGGEDATIAAVDGGADGNNTFTDPCGVVDCQRPRPIAATCGDGNPSDVLCKRSFFGACEWHLDCGTP